MSEHLKMQTPDSTEENIAKIAALFPSAVTEMRGEDGAVKKGINFETLKQLLSHDIVDGKEHYEFTWVGKKQAMAEAARPTTQTLRPVPADSKNWDTTQNLYIEGDNLEVLKILQQSYLGKVKMIYIDPPYNTGSDRFVYTDDFRTNYEDYAHYAGLIDENENITVQDNNTSNPHFHSDWCKMLSSRLRVARDFLTPDGVIAISIDDNELKNLIKICDDIFGEKNFVAMLTIIVKTEGRRYGYFAKTHENMLIYASRIENLELNEIEVVGTDFKYYDELGGYNLTDLRNQNARAFNSLNRPNLRYPFYVDEAHPDQKGFCKVSTTPQEGYKEVWAITTNGYKSVWRWGKGKAQKEIRNLTARKSADGEYRIYQKYRKLTQTAKTVWMEKNFTSGKGTKELQALLGSGIFDFPKPLALMLQLAKICSNEDSIVMDFFSGSATTAHAVMQLNAEDGGHRKFIMVQLPEACDEKSEAYKAGYKNICEIGKERIRRAGEKIKTEHPEAEVDTGFRVFRVDSSNMKDVYFHPEQVTQTMLGETVSNIKEDRTDLDLLYDCMLRCGVEIDLPHTTTVVDDCKVHNVDNGALMACFDPRVTDNVIYAMAQENPVQAIFRDSSFATDADKINVTEIFKNLSPDTKVKVI